MVPQPPPQPQKQLLDEKPKDSSDIKQKIEEIKSENVSWS
jgi:hypothetical protein